MESLNRGMELHDLTQRHSTVRAALYSRVIATLVVAGVVPAVAINYFVLQGLTRDGTRSLDFALHLIPLAMGALAVRACHGGSPRLVATLGVLAGFIELGVMSAIFSPAGHRFLESHFGAYTVPAFEDYVAVPATIALFIFGGVLANRNGPKQPSRPVRAGTPARVSQSDPHEGGTAMTAVLSHPATVFLIGALGVALQAYSTFGAGHGH